MDYRYVRQPRARRGREGRVEVLLDDAALRWQAGDAGGALATLDQAIALEPRHAPAHARRGGVLAGLGRFTEAEIELRRAATLAAPDDDLLFALGQTLQAQKKLAEARTLYDLVLRRAPGHLAARHERATALADLGELDMAIGQYEQVLEHDPRSVPALVNRALLRVEHGPAGTVVDLDDLERAVTIAPAHGLLRCHAALVQRLIGDPAVAERHYQAAARVFADTDAIRASHDYALDRVPGPILLGERLRVLTEALECAGTPGFVAEFGVYRGVSLNFIAARIDAPVAGFDSFEGLPQAWTATDRKGKYTTQGARPEVRSNVTLEVGRFEDTLPDYLARTNGPARLIHIDCDLYDSTVTVLRQIAPRLVPGSVIVFDEYFGYAGWRDHEFKAFAELTVAHGLRYRYLAFNPFAKQAAVAIV